MLRPFLALTATVLLPALAFAGQIHVPGQVADLQTAIALAAPGDVLIVDGGTWSDLVVDKPLYITGVEGNEPVIHCTGAGAPPYAAVTLAGPGAGLVELVNLTITGGVINGIVFGQPFEGIAGGGFDDLRVLHCEVSAGTWVFPTGVGQGGDAIDVGVLRLLVADSVVTGGTGVDDGSGVQTFSLASPGAGIRSTLDVIVTESTISGGDGLVQNVFEPDCPLSADAFSGGAGGDALVAGGTAWYTTSTLVPGSGALLTCVPTGNTYQKPDGAAVVANLDDPVPGDLIGAGEVVIGQSWSVNFTATSFQTYLALGLPAPPIQVGNKGLLFMNPSTLFLFSFSTFPGLNGIILQATPDPAFVGVTVVFQTYTSGSQKLSNPVFATHVLP